MKIFDCFTYCGEDDILEIRLATLYNQVNRFIIIEGNKFFNGTKKNKIFNINNFKKYKSKIDYFFIEDFPFHNGNNWVYENFQRNQIKLGLKKLNQDDIVLISDVDEIPNLTNKKFINYDTTVFLQNMYYYKLNILLYKGLKWENKWPGTKSCKYKYFETAQKVREFRVKNYPWWRFDRKIKRYIESNGGWHFSFLMDPKKISQKITLTTHELDHVLGKGNYQLKILNDEKIINKKISNLKDIYGRQDIRLKKVEIDQTYPEIIKNNTFKFRHLIS